MEALKMWDELDSLLDDIDGEEKKGFVITDDSGAEWCIKKIRRVRKESERLCDTCKAEIEYYKQKLDEYEQKAESECQFYTDKLLKYFRTVEPKETKTQLKYELPSGKLIVKKAGYKYNHDDEALISRLKAEGLTDFVKTVEKLDWAEYKKTLTFADGVAVDKNGEVVIEVTSEAVPERFEVEV